MVSQESLNYKILETGKEKSTYQESILKLFRSTFGRELKLSDWDHLFNSSPYEDGKTVVALVDETVVGVANLIPQKLCISEREHDYYLFTTSMVDQDYRREGVYVETIKKTKEILEKSDKSFVLAFPNQTALLLLTKLFRFNRIGEGFPIVEVDQIKGIRPLKNGQAIRLDPDFSKWRFEHREYFGIFFDGFYLVCKEFNSSLDIIEVLDGEDEGLQSFDSSKLTEYNSNIIMSGRLTGDYNKQEVNRLNPVYYSLKTNLDLSEVDISMLMWDVV